MCMGRTKSKIKCGWGHDNENDKSRTDTMARIGTTVPMGRG